MNLPMEVHKTSYNTFCAKKLNVNLEEKKPLQNQVQYKGR